MDLIIVGAGGMGRDVFTWLSQEIKNKKGFRIKGFLDDNPQILRTLSYPVKLIGSISDYQPKINESLILAILDPKIKKKIVESLMQKGANFYNLIYPSTVMGTNVRIGRGCIICPNCLLGNDLTIGNFVFINANSTIGHGGIIGDYTSINGSVDITGNVEVGHSCLFGVGAKVIPGRKIGNQATVGAGSIVIKNVPHNVTVFGNPAKIICDLSLPINNTKQVVCSHSSSNS